MQLESALQPHHVAEEGAFSIAVSSEPVLQYFPVQDRCEPIRLVLASQHQIWYEPPAEPAFEVSQKDLEGYPFRQLPRFIGGQHLKGVQEDVDLMQPHAILRHLGRKYGLYGNSTKAAARIDMVVEAVAQVTQKLEEVWSVQKLEPCSRQQYEAEVLVPEEELKRRQTPGPGLASFELLLRAGVLAAGAGVQEEQKWIVPPDISIADMALFVLVDMHLRVFEDAMQHFPRLLAHHARVAAQPGIAEYLHSSNRHTMVWAAEWIKLYLERKAKDGGPPELELPQPPATERLTMFPFDAPREAEKDDNFADLA